MGGGVGGGGAVSLVGGGGAQRYTSNGGALLFSVKPLGVLSSLGGWGEARRCQEILVKSRHGFTDSREVGETDPQVKSFQSSGNQMVLSINLFFR